MKKSLLLLGTLLFSGLSAMAQSFDVDWTAPEVEIPPTSFVPFQMEKAYFLWNVGAQGFYMNNQGGNVGPYWGTRAMVYSDKCTPVRFTRTNPGGIAEDWTKEGVTDNTGLFTSHVKCADRGMDAFMCTFSDNDVLWTDNNGNGNRYFQVVPSGDYYQIKGSPLSGQDKSTSVLVAAAEGEFKVVNFAAEGTDDNDKWAFVDADPWVKVEAAAALKQAIEDAEGEGIPSSALAKDYAVYNNTSSTLEQLQNAASRVKAAETLVLAIGEAGGPGLFPVENALCDNPDATLEQLQKAKARVGAVVALQEAYNAAVAEGVDENILVNEKAALESTDNSVEDLKAATERVKAVQKLKGILDVGDLQTDGEVDYTAEKAVYINPKSTVEQLAAAGEAADAKTKQYLIDHATEDNPMDFTDWLKNPSFSTGNIEGWDCTFVNEKNATNIGYQGANYTNGEVTISQFIEAWANNWAHSDFNGKGYASLGQGELSQTIADMPQGKYSFAVDCISVQQDGQAPAGTNPVKGVELFATGGDLDIFTNIATGDGKPEHFEVVFINTGGNIKLGLRTTEECTANWIAADNFTLKYYGPVTEDPYKVLLNDDIKAALEKYPIKNGDIAFEDGEITTQSYIDTYVKVIAEAQAATENYESYRTQIADAIKNIEAGIAAYNKFQQKVADWEQDYLEKSDIENFGSDSEEWGNLGDFINGGEVEGYPTPVIEDVTNNHELTPAEIDDYIKKVDELATAAFAASMRPGMDCSYMLTNASFAKGFEGWVNNSAGAWGPATLGGLKDFPCVEVYCGMGYAGKVEVYQEITGLPVGVYELSCKAFQRNPQPGNPVTLYMNDKETTVQGIADDAIAAANAVNGVNCLNDNSLFAGSGDGMTFNGEPVYDTGGTTNADTGYDENGDAIGFNEDGSYASEPASYSPNGMTGASIAFRANRFEQSAKGLVADGKLKVGLKGMAEWVLWAQFKLTYLGEDPGAYGEMLDDAIKEETAYLGENYKEEDEVQTMTNPALADYQKAIADAKAVQKSQDATELKDALNALMAAGKAVRENVAAVHEFEETQINLIAAQSDENAKEAGKTAYTALEPELDAYMSLNTEGLKALIEKMALVQEKLKFGDFDTKADITSVMVNPGFEIDGGHEKKGITGWTDNGSEKIQYQDNTGWSDQGKVGTYYAERWHINGNVDMSQTLTKLPAGFYELTLNAQSGGCENAVMYAVVGGEEKTTAFEDVCKRYSLVVELTEESDITIGVKWSDTGNGWTRFDDFHLTYYGSNENADMLTGIRDIDAADVLPAAQKTRKVLENGRIVIYKNGQKYNVAGQAIK